MLFILRHLLLRGLSCACRCNCHSFRCIFCSATALVHTAEHVCGPTQADIGSLERQLEGSGQLVAPLTVVRQPDQCLATRESVRRVLPGLPAAEHLHLPADDSASCSAAPPAILQHRNSLLSRAYSTILSLQARGAMCEWQVDPSDPQRDLCNAQHHAAGRRC